MADFDQLKLENYTNLEEIEERNEASPCCFLTMFIFLFFSFAHNQMPYCNFKCDCHNMPYYYYKYSRAL